MRFPCALTLIIKEGFGSISIILPSFRLQDGRREELPAFCLHLPLVVGQRWRRAKVLFSQEKEQRWGRLNIFQVPLQLWQKLQETEHQWTQQSLSCASFFPLFAKPFRSLFYGPIQQSTHQAKSSFMWRAASLSSMRA